MQEGEMVIVGSKFLRRIVCPRPAPPPPNSSQLTVDPAEVLALKSIVMCVVVELANAQKKLGTNPLSWLNRVAANCENIIHKAEIPGDQAEGLRQDAQEYVTNIFQGL
jgi:hypothetical protein